MAPLANPLIAWGLQQFGARKFHTSGDARLLPLSFRLKKQDVAVFAREGALEARLDRIDEERPIERIFVMGCGRSGTWLLTGLLSTFKDTCVVAKEVPIEFFAQLSTTGKTLVLKRNNVAFERLWQMPARIKVVYAIRHPYDVLTSHNPTSAQTYHIDIKRWLAEIAALRLALEIGRKDFCIVRYEDMVTDAERVQRKIAEELGLEAGTSVENLAIVFKPSDVAKSAMHGLRRIDTQSLHRYKDDPNKIAYLKSIKPRLGETLDWVASRFGYDISLA
jgi:Sulfotransferase family